MNARNYQKELDKTLEMIREGDIVPSLLMHSCCAPCSSYCLEYLSQYFRITDFYYNPNIQPGEEYIKRVREQERFINEFNAKTADPASGDGIKRYPISFIEGEYDPEAWDLAVKGLEDEPEGGERCSVCFSVRLRETAKLAAEKGFDYFTTTLTLSPLKDAKRLNEIGEAAGEEFGVRFLNSDFKKRDGYKRSIELSKEYGLYRQNYCGCVYSRSNENDLIG